MDMKSACRNIFAWMLLHNGVIVVYFERGMLAPPQHWYEYWK